MDSILGQKHVIAKDVKNVYLLLLCLMRDIKSMSGGMPWPKTGATQSHVQLGMLTNDKNLQIIKMALLGYGWFAFIVDVGSSLGLWLALSVLDILDILIDIIVFCCINWKNVYLH